MSAPANHHDQCPPPPLLVPSNRKSEMYPYKCRYILGPNVMKCELAYICLRFHITNFVYCRVTHILIRYTIQSYLLYEYNAM